MAEAVVEGGCARLRDPVGSEIRDQEQLMHLSQAQFDSAALQLARAQAAWLVQAQQFWACGNRAEHADIWRWTDGYIFGAVGKGEAEGDPRFV